MSVTRADATSEQQSLFTTQRLSQKQLLGSDLTLLMSPSGDACAKHEASRRQCATFSLLISLVVMTSPLRLDDVTAVTEALALFNGDPSMVAIVGSSSTGKLEA